MQYMNYDLLRADNWLEKRLFIHQWAQMGFRDQRWVPPLFFALRPSLTDPHMQRVDATLLRLTAVGFQARRTDRGHSIQGVPLSASMEQTIATAALQLDPRRSDRTTHLTLFNTVNNRDSLRIFLDKLGELLMDAGSFRLLGPFGASPFLERGVLQNHWNLTPPIYTAYNQPFLPELMEKVLRPFATQQLYTVPIRPNSVEKTVGNVTLTPFEPARLAADLLPLLQAACQNRLGLPLPDEMEARFMLRQLLPEQLTAWGAELDGRIVGFFLVQPDDGAARRRSRGGKLAWQATLYQLLRRRPTRRGRLLFGAVLPNYRKRGVGQMLLHKLNALGIAQGWERVHIGPLDSGDTAVPWLRTHANAIDRQQYTIYEYTA